MQYNSSSNIFQQKVVAHIILCKPKARLTTNFVKQMTLWTTGSIFLNYTFEDTDNV